MDTDPSTQTTSDDTTGLERLPAPVRTFTAAHAARDADTALAVLGTDAVITDEGSTFSGPESLRRFVTEAGTEFTYTDEITGAWPDGGVWVVRHHLEGDFPGGTVDLDYRFTLAGDRIARVDIVVG